METIREIILTPKDDLKSLYREQIGDYPKFYKMDTLSRLGFVGVELLLKGLDAVDSTGSPTVDSERTAIVFANRSASLKNDADYQATIEDKDNYYPSPSLFVYTLPNIVCGEVAIRHHIFGETAFYVLEREEDLTPILEATMATTEYTTYIVGWLECKTAEDYYAHLQLIKK